MKLQKLINNTDKTIMHNLIVHGGDYVFPLIGDPHMNIVQALLTK